MYDRLLNKELQDVFTTDRLDVWSRRFDDKVCGITDIIQSIRQPETYYIEKEKEILQPENNASGIKGKITLLGNTAKSCNPMHPKQSKIPSSQNSYHLLKITP